MNITSYEVMFIRNKHQGVKHEKRAYNYLPPILHKPRKPYATSSTRTTNGQANERKRNSRGTGTRTKHGIAQSETPP